MYNHTYPILRIFYYLDEKYSFAERDTSRKELEAYIQEIIPKIMENSIRDIVGQVYGLNVFHYQTRDLELDGIYAKFKKPEIALEVKWKNKLRKKDLVKIENNLEKINVKRRILFVPDKKNLFSDKIEIMDISDLEF